MTGGTYTLVVSVPRDLELAVGALGVQSLPVGGYAYTGSAFGSGGFSRIDRHQRVATGEHDVRHWHVDYLLGHEATTVQAVVRAPGADVECAVAGRLPPGPTAGFGSSDCDCRSHLGYQESVEHLRAAIDDAYRAVAAEHHWTSY